MAYLFWAFAVVWVGIFFYLYSLMRRTRALERQVAELLDRSRTSASASTRAGTLRSGAGRP